MKLYIRNVWYEIVVLVSLSTIPHKNKTKQTKQNKAKQKNKKGGNASFITSTRRLKIY